MERCEIGHQSTTDNISIGIGKLGDRTFNWEHDATTKDTDINDIYCNNEEVVLSTIGRLPCA